MPVLSESFSKTKKKTKADLEMERALFGASYSEGEENEKEWKTTVFEKSPPVRRPCSY